MKQEKLKKSKGKIILIILVVFLVIILSIFATVYFFIKGKLGKINYMNVNKEDIQITEGVNEHIGEYRNIALLGIDSMYDDYESETRSDGIILLTINEKTKEIKLTSVYRDTYMDISGHSLDKVNHSYAYGGPLLVMNTLNKNMDLNITEFVTVNFSTAIDAVDAVGGVEINITSEELKYINGYIRNIIKVTGNKSDEISKTGKQNLNGVQALAYSRIRYTEGWDYKRTERIRTVLTKVFEKTKKLSVSELNELSDKILPELLTNVSQSEIIKLLPQIATYKVVDSKGWPYNTTGSTIGGVYYGIPITLESNVKRLHEEIFGKDNYTPSDTVKEISEQIIKKTGIR